MQRRILAAGSDFHGGSKFGLMAPDVTLFDEDEEGNPIPYTPRQTASQVYLWRLCLEGIEKIKALAGEDRIDFMHGGDECHGNKHPQSLVSTRMADQIAIAEANFDPILEQTNAQVTRLVSGTGAHNFLEGSSALIVSRLLASNHPGKDIKAVFHGLLDIDGFSVDYSHHGPHPGSREWLKGNIARFYLRDLMMRELMHGNKPPDLVLRGHFHTPIIETLTMCGCTSTLMILPSMCVIDEYTRQATRSVNSITNGLVAFEIVNGKLLDIHEYTQNIDIRTRETI
jgi:hypothetical protein